MIAVELPRDNPRTPPIQLNGLLWELVGSWYGVDKELTRSNYGAGTELRARRSLKRLLNL
jgi:hypothetical protein